MGKKAYEHIQGNTTSLLDDALIRVHSSIVMAATAFCGGIRQGKEVWEQGGSVCGVRPKGGGGVDHPREVQQKRTQIQIFIPGGYSYPLTILTI